MGKGKHGYKRAPRFGLVKDDAQRTVGVAWHVLGRVGVKYWTTPYTTCEHSACVCGEETCDCGCDCEC